MTTIAVAVAVVVATTLGLEASVAAVGRLLRNVVGLCMEVSGKYSAPSVFGKILNNLLTAIESIPPAGKADEQTVAAATGTWNAPGMCPLTPVWNALTLVWNALECGQCDTRTTRHDTTRHTGHYQTWILARMNEKLIFEQSSGLMLFARQALSSLRSNLFLTANSGPIILYLAAIVSTMCKKIVTLLDLTETCKLIYRHRKARENRTNSLRHHSLAVRVVLCVSCVSCRAVRVVSCRAVGDVCVCACACAVGGGVQDAEAMLESMRDDVDIWEEEAENSSNLRRGSFQVTSAAARADARDPASPLVAPLHSAAATGGKKEYAHVTRAVCAVRVSPVCAVCAVRAVGVCGWCVRLV
jgi:hypothetical protein